MAVFSAATVDRINSIEDSKIRSYLYKLNEDLTYMFNNLTVEDNYSELAQLTFAQNEETLSQLEISVDGIKATVVYKDSVVAAINLSTEGVKIQGDKITLEGVVTANNYFKINLDGSMEAKNGTFSGTISGSKITGGSCDIGCFSATSDEAYLGDFYVSGDDTGTIISNNGNVIISMDGSDIQSGTPFIRLTYNNSKTNIYPGGINTTGEIKSSNYVFCEDVQFDSYQNTVMYWIDWLYEQVSG